MIKINEEMTKLIKELVSTGKSCGLDKIVIDNKTIRGIAADLNTGIFLLEEIEFPDKGFSEIGLGRLNVLKTRLDLLDKNSTIEASIKEKPDGTKTVNKLFLKDKNTNIEFNCTDPLMIKSPKKVNDTFAYRFSIEQDTVKVMSKIIAAISSKSISFSSDDDGTVRFKATDEEGDKFNHLISKKFSCDSSVSTKFYFEYKIKNLLPLFKEAFAETTSVDVEISTRGYLRFLVNGLHIYILSEK